MTANDCGLRLMYETPYLRSLRFTAPVPLAGETVARISSLATSVPRLSSWPHCQGRPTPTASAPVSWQRRLRHHRQQPFAVLGAYWWQGIPSFGFAFTPHGNCWPRSHIWQHEHLLSVTFQAWQLARRCSRSSCRCPAAVWDVAWYRLRLNLSSACFWLRCCRASTATASWSFTWRQPWQCCCYRHSLHSPDVCRYLRRQTTRMMDDSDTWRDGLELVVRAAQWWWCRTVVKERHHRGQHTTAHRTVDTPAGRCETRQRWIIIRTF